MAGCFQALKAWHVIAQVIYHLETFDVTTIRASTPMYLMARRIRATGVKMVLSGEGADEIFGGYLYFHKAPNPEEFHAENCRKAIGAGSRGRPLMLKACQAQASVFYGPQSLLLWDVDISASKSAK
eukprot:Skav202002  [mRNA]  locus=scaffold269:412070:414111:+ [translate_table: standard]